MSKITRIRNRKTLVAVFLLFSDIFWTDYVVITYFKLFFFCICCDKILIFMNLFPQTQEFNEQYELIQFLNTIEIHNNNSLTTDFLEKYHLF